MKGKFKGLKEVDNAIDLYKRLIEKTPFVKEIVKETLKKQAKEIFEDIDKLIIKHYDYLKFESEYRKLKHKHIKEDGR